MKATRRGGFTLIDLLVSMVILGVILIATTDLIVKNQQVANRQIVAQQAKEDARLALLRMSELFSGAAYVYPGDQLLALPDGSSITTGDSALAVLMPWGGPYCNDGGSAPYDPGSVNRNSYCAVIYALDERSKYVDVLGANPKASDKVLVEHVIKWIDWPVNSLPTRDFSGMSQITGIVADSVAANHTTMEYSTGSLSQVTHKPIDPLLLSAHETSNPADAKALIDNVSVELGLKHRGKPLQTERRNLFARAVPRSAPPGTGN